MLLIGLLIFSINFVLIYGACPPIVDESVTAECKLDGAIVDCALPVEEGTRARVSCAAGYEARDPAYSTRLCAKGLWDVPLKKCVPVCGVLSPLPPLLLRGSPVLHSIPWHVQIYTKIQNEYQKRCEGSLISPNIVLSVAHCFTDREGKLIDFSEISVTAGKSHTEFDDARDSHAQVASIEKVVIPSNYKDILTAYRDDISVLVLKKPFSLNSYVQPVCVDWTSQNETEQLQQNALTVVTGSVGPGRSKIPELSKEHMMFQKISECYKAVPQSFYPYFTHDKFCAVSVPGSAATCSVLSGSGLAFASNATDKYFIRGIVSVGPAQTAQTCMNLPVLLTRISTLLPWIAEAVAHNKIS